MKTLMTVIKSNNTDKRPNGDGSSNIKCKIKIRKAKRQICASKKKKDTLKMKKKIFTANNSSEKGIKTN